jgi:hypothetical protein
MYLPPDDAKRLFEAGFKLQHQLEGSVFYFEDEEWIVGGRIDPDGPSSISPKIIKKGIWLPSLEDLLEWLRYRDFELEIKTSRYGTTAIARDEEGRRYEASSGSEDHALYKIILQVLQSGNVPEWNTFTVEIID